MTSWSLEEESIPNGSQSLCHRVALFRHCYGVVLFRHCLVTVIWEMGVITDRLRGFVIYNCGVRVTW